jgi:hypothetical protein
LGKVLAKTGREEGADLGRHWDWVTSLDGELEGNLDGDLDNDPDRVLQQGRVKGICPRGNNKVVIILFHVHNRCLFLMLELY